MRIAVTLVDPRRGSRDDVLIDAEETTPTGEVIDALLGREQAATEDRVVSLLGRRGGTSAGGHRTVFHRGAPLERDQPIGEAGLVEGSLLALDDAQMSVLDEPEGAIEIRVVAGSGAGVVHRLMPGDATIGSDPACVIRLADPRLPPVCATLTVTAEAATVRAVAGAADVVGALAGHLDPPLALDRAALTEDGLEWPVGGQVRIGSVLLELERITPPDADVSPAAEPGWLDYNRPPRLLPPARRTRFALPSRPRPNANRGLPWLVMLAPMTLAVVMAVALHQPTYLMIGLMSPLMMLGSYVQGRRHRRIEEWELDIVLSCSGASLKATALGVADLDALAKAIWVIDEEGGRR